MTGPELAKQHGPGVAVGTLALAVALASGGSTTEVVRVAQTGAPYTAPEQPHPSLPIGAVSLVSCGEMRGADGARVDGDSHTGTIRLGPGAAGKCTLVFERAMPPGARCAVDGAQVVQLRGTDLVIDGAASVVAYRCEAR